MTLLSLFRKSILSVPFMNMDVQLLFLQILYFLQNELVKKSLRKMNTESILCQNSCLKELPTGKAEPNAT